MDPAEYNYPRFDDYVTSGAEAATVGTFRNCFHVGDRATDFRLLRLDDDGVGGQVQLSQMWQSQLRPEARSGREGG